MVVVLKYLFCRLKIKAFEICGMNLGVIIIIDN